MKVKIWVTLGLLGTVLLVTALSLRPASTPTPVPAPNLPAPQALSSGLQDATAAVSIPTPPPTQPADAKIPRAFAAALAKFRQKQALLDAQRRGGDDENQPLLDAAEALAEIVELEREHLDEAPAFQRFYFACAKDQDVIVVIRAQCLETYGKSSGLSPRDYFQVQKEFPEHVTRLTKSLL